MLVHSNPAVFKLNVRIRHMMGEVSIIAAKHVQSGVQSIVGMFEAISASEDFDPTATANLGTDVKFCQVCALLARSCRMSTSNAREILAGAASGGGRVGSEHTRTFVTPKKRTCTRE